MDVKPGVCLVRVNEYGAVHIQGLKLGQPREVKFYQVEILSDHQRSTAAGGRNLWQSVIGRWPESLSPFLWPWLP